jgi:hypothetical protein
MSYKKKSQGGANVPTFNDLLRQFYKRSHPDLLRSSYPDYAEINDRSLQLLNGILSSCKEYNKNPPQTSLSIPFHIMSENNTIVAHELKIRTNGGDCRSHLTKSFQTFFVESGVCKNGGKFVWGKEFFPIEVYNTRKIPVNDS